LGERVVRASRVDLGHLPVIADEHELGLRVVPGVREPGEVTGADQAGLIDDQDRPMRQATAALELVQHARDRARWDPCLAFELERRARRQRAPVDGNAFGFPGFTGGDEHERLAGACRGAYEGNAVAADAELLDDVTLLGREQRMVAPRPQELRDSLA
jgi:hypothetical protein